MTAALSTGKRYLTPQERQERLVAVRKFGRNVYFGQWTLGDTEPVFHRWSAKRMSTVTACGLTIWHDGRELMTYMPAFHAVKFGRPCTKCWS